MNQLIKTKSFVITLLMIFSFNLYSQEIQVEINDRGDEITMTADQLDEIANDIDSEAETQDSKVKRMLKKIGKGFKNLSKSLKKDKDRNRNKKKRKISLKSILRGAGKGSTFISVNLLKPFVNVAAYFTGLFERPGKNQDSKAFLQFFLNHEEELDEKWRGTGTVEKYAEVLQASVEEILLEKQIVIIQDLFMHYVKVEASRDSVLKTLGIEPQASYESIKTIQEIAFAELGPELMFFEIDPDLINNHPEYQELRPLLGDIEGNDLDSIMTFNPSFDLLSLGNRSRIQLHEGLIAFSAKIFVPKIVIGIVSKSVASAIMGVGLIADAGFVTSSLLCTMNKKMKKKIKDGDEDLINFCSYVVNKSAYEISKSRAKGYVKGKNSRRSLIKGFEKFKRKFRRKKKKKQVESEPELQAAQNNQIQ